MPLAEQRFTGITPERFASMVAQVEKALGVKIAANTGTESKGSYSVRWEYNAGAKVLAIQVLRKPFYAPDSVVQDQVRKMVEG